MRYVGDGFSGGDGKWMVAFMLFKRMYPQHKAFLAAKNVGYVRGCNIGMRNARKRGGLCFLAQYRYGIGG